MFKFVLCALFAVAVADPQFFYSSYPEAYVAPATTTVTRHASSVVSSPLYSSYPYGISHLIKKREAQFLPSVITPTTYLSGSWASPYSYIGSNGYLPYSSVLDAHLIKKRSAQLLAPASYITPYNSYIAPGAVAYSSGLYHDNLFNSYLSPAHLIKKRSAAWATPYLTSSYVATSPIATSYSTAVLPSSPYWSAYGALPFIKK